MTFGADWSGGPCLMYSALSDIPRDLPQVPGQGPCLGPGLGLDRDLGPGTWVTVRYRDLDIGKGPGLDIGCF